MKYMQSLIKTMPFYLLSYYKSIQFQGKQDEQYWNEITVEFLKIKHNADIIRREFSIKMYTGGSPYKPYFIALTSQDQIIVGLTKKTVASYMVGDLTLLD